MPICHKVNIHEQTCILVATHGQYDEDAIDGITQSRLLCWYGRKPKTHEACRTYLREAGFE